MDSWRSVVHIWDCSVDELIPLGTVGTDSEPDGVDPGWNWHDEGPVAAWHPEQPILVVADGHELTQWAPAGAAVFDGIPPMAEYQNVVFGPDGLTLWASPSSALGWEASDVIDLTLGTITYVLRWDTGVAVHPAGGLVASLRSDQAATHLFFARVTEERPAAMRVLRSAVVLACDGYRTPVFSADGRHFAVRGNSYDHSIRIRRVRGRTQKSLSVCLPRVIRLRRPSWRLICLPIRRSRRWR